MNAVQMARADEAAASSGVPVLDLMERAGAAVARAAARMAGAAYGKRFLIVCGKGNNGGDGFVAARKLAGAGGHPVVVLLEDARKLNEFSAQMFARLNGVRVMDFNLASLKSEAARADIIIDAIVGTGVKGALRDPASSAVEAINASRKPVVAIDIPSGVDATSGRTDGPAIQAALTVTMQAHRSGLLLLPGADHAGTVEIADIGLTIDDETAMHIAQGADVAIHISKRTAASHKRNSGKVLIVAGSLGMTGAAILSARAALKAGAGLVRVATSRGAAPLVSHGVVEALAVGLAETAAGALDEQAADDILELADGVDAVVIGPGLGRDDSTAALIRKLTARIEKPLVLDADGISAFEGDPERLKRRPAATLLTPHSGELARLMGTSPELIDADRIGHAMRAATSSGGSILLKGFHTIVARPNGDVVFVTTGGPELATAGSGDVLSGICGAFATATDIFEAGWSAAWVHGKAGEIRAEYHHGAGVVAGDLIDAIGAVLGGLR